MNLIACRKSVWRTRNGCNCLTDPTGKINIPLTPFSGLFHPETNRSHRVPGIQKRSTGEPFRGDCPRLRRGPDLRSLHRHTLARRSKLIHFTRDELLLNTRVTLRLEKMIARGESFEFVGSVRARGSQPGNAAFVCRVSIIGTRTGA